MFAGVVVVVNVTPSPPLTPACFRSACAFQPSTPPDLLIQAALFAQEVEQNSSEFSGVFLAVIHSFLLIYSSFTQKISCQNFVLLVNHPLLLRSDEQSGLW